MSDLLDWLRGLRRHTKTRGLFEFENVRFRKDHVEVRQIFRQTAHLDMIALADDDWVIAFADQFGDRAMGGVNQRASGFHYLEAAVAHAVERFLRSAMGRDH